MSAAALGSDGTGLLTPAPSADPDRRKWLLATGAMGGVAVIGTGVPLVSTLAPSERAKAAGGPVEVDISDLAARRSNGAASRFGSCAAPPR